MITEISGDVTMVTYSAILNDLMSGLFYFYLSVAAGILFIDFKNT